MNTLHIDFGRKLGPVKPVNGVGQPPILGITNASLFSYLRDAGIPYSRLHDVGGAFGCGCYVDIPNIFPVFDADDDDPASYMFAHTDWIIGELVKNGVEPVYRLGVTIENAAARWASPRIYPPKDFAKWARVCEHVIRHYTEGWADGFRYRITYWEIWNEPDNHVIPEKNEMWRGTAEDYYRLYEVTANHLKHCFPHIRVGGPACCGFYAVTSTDPDARTRYFLSFAEGFLRWISSDAHKAPLDFFSWHSYAAVEETRRHACFCRSLLDRYGFTGTETHLNEWNPSPRVFGSMTHAVNTAAMLLTLQNAPVDAAMFYDARIGLSEYGSLFDPISHTPYADYDAFVLFGRLRALGTQVQCTHDVPGLYALAAADGREGGVMLVNTAKDERTIVLHAHGKVSCELTDARHRLEPAPILENGRVTLPAESIAYLKIETIG